MSTSQFIVSLHAQPPPPDYIVVGTGETLTPQQSCMLSEWSQRPLFHAAAPPTAAIEIVDDQDDDDDDADNDDDDADDDDDDADDDDDGCTNKNDDKHMRLSPEP